MRISMLLTRKGTAVATIAPEASIGDAVDQLAELRIGALVVSGDGAHIEGIVSERDVVRALASQTTPLLEAPVSSIMSTNVHTAGEDDEVESLMALMTDHRIRHVPVVEDGELRGIVSIGDVVKSRIDELERDRKELVDYINGR